MDSALPRGRSFRDEDVVDASCMSQAPGEVRGALLKAIGSSFLRKLQPDEKPAAQDEDALWWNMRGKCAAKQQSHDQPLSRLRF